MIILIILLNFDDMLNFKISFGPQNFLPFHNESISFNVQQQTFYYLTEEHVYLLSLEVL